MTTKLLDANQFRRLARRGDAAGAGVARLSPIAVVDDDARTVRFVLSDNSVDRMNDRIAVDGWELAGYRKNPVVLWSHDASAPPIGKMPRIFTSGNKLMGDVKFASPAAYPFADTVYRLVVDGFINSGSVGFIPIDFKFSSDPDRPMGIDFRRQELLEFSICPIPANANALVEGRAMRSRRAAADPIAELGGLLGRLARARQLRDALPASSMSRWERYERVEALRRQLRD